MGVIETFDQSEDSRIASRTHLSAVMAGFLLGMICISVVFHT